MRYAHMSLTEIRDMDFDMAIELFIQLSDLIKKENGDQNANSGLSKSRFKPRN